ncbi:MULTISPECIES: PadR family transcriptional regulator [unclassified Streptomyces]|uniref:PadR family transcriptional regulator n=1 Tax=unclassified Streptomyces TaxID=2593676 RepID=UPI0016609BD3|nr:MULTISPECIES: PadR family transcriptional regulator [unclassified Streptomyces]MBD0712333.1 hypothetical protein [Streptomyces sp. CBMA291]MBD0716707.1 hypothetical protein [Streptomyces sp. CBMA370]
MVKFEYVLLALLAGRPRSGFDLGRWLETEGQFLRSRAHHSQIYRLLARLEGNGWAEYEVDPRDGRPDAKVYRITPDGRDALLVWVRSPYQPTSRYHDPDFLARFAFAAPLDPEAAARLIRTEIAFRRDHIARNRHRDRTLVFEDPIPEMDTAFAQEVFDELHQRGADGLDEWIAWLEQMLHRLEDRPSREG